MLEPFEELRIPQRHAFGWQQELVPLPRSRHMEARMSDFETLHTNDLDYASAGATLSTDLNNKYNL